MLKRLTISWQQITVSCTAKDHLTTDVMFPTVAFFVCLTAVLWKKMIYDFMKLSGEVGQSQVTNRNDLDYHMYTSTFLYFFRGKSFLLAAQQKIYEHIFMK